MHIIIQASRRLRIARADRIGGKQIVIVNGLLHHRCSGAAYFTEVMALRLCAQASGPEPGSIGRDLP